MRGHPVRVPVSGGAGPGAEGTGGTGPADVDAWFDRLPTDQREELLALRTRIREVVPDATERISYRVPTFVLDGPLVALNASRSGLSLITMRPGLLERLGDRLSGVSWSGSTLRFQPGRPLPDDVLRLVLEERVEQNLRGE